MKRNLVKIIAVVVVLIIGGVVYSIIEQTKTYPVTFELDPAIKSVTVFDEKNTVDEVVSNGQVVKLRSGAYSYKMTGDTIADSTRSFTVGTNEQTVTVPPSYTTAYLETLASEIEPTIESDLKKSYPAAMRDFEVNNVTVFDDAKWGGVVLTPLGMDQSNPNGFYRVLIENKDGVWKISGSPRIVLTKYTNQDVSVDILSKVNDLTAL